MTTMADTFGGYTLDQLKAMADAASVGPWGSTRTNTGIVCASGYVAATVPSGVHERQANKLLIVASRSALPALAAEIERLREALTEIRDLRMGRGDGVVGDFIEEVQSIAARALTPTEKEGDHG